MPGVVCALCIELRTQQLRLALHVIVKLIEELCWSCLVCGRVMCQLVLWIKGKNVHTYLLTLGLLELVGEGGVE